MQMFTYPRYQPTVKWQDNCGSSDDRVVVTPREFELWGVSPHSEQLDANTYRVESDTPITATVFVPHGSTELISQDGHVDDRAAIFSHTFSSAPCTLATSTPVITGTARVGRTLTATPGAWTEGTAFTYQWMRDGIAIRGATGTAYTVTGKDRGSVITVEATGTKAEHTTARRTSLATSPVVAGRSTRRS